MSVRERIHALLLTLFAGCVIALPVCAGAAEVEGLVRVDPELVRGIVAPLTVDSPPGDVASAIRRLYQLGYFQDIRAVRRDDQLVFELRERPFVVGVERHGIEELSDEDVDKIVKIPTNAFLDPAALQRVRSGLLAKYEEEGFAETTVDVHTEPADGPSEVRVVIDVTEVAKIRIVETRIEGNVKLSDAELVGRLQSRPPSVLGVLSGQGKFDRKAAEADRFRIEAAYLEQGFLKVQVEGPRVTFLPDGRQVIVEYSVREGAQYRLGRLDFDGDLFVSNDTLERLVGLRVGEPVDRLQLERGIQQIVDTYGDFGFAFARVVPDFEFDEDAKTADVHVRISRGPMVFVHRIRIQGNTKTRDKVIRRELEIKEGDLYSGVAVRKSRERVYALGFFESVTFETQAVEEDLIDIVIQVAERPTGTASAGLGFSSVDKLVGNLRLNFGNLMGYGVRLDLQVEFGGNRQSFSASYSDPYFLDTKISFSADAFRTRQQFFVGTGDIQSFTQNNLGGSLSLGYKLAPYTRAFLTFRDEKIDFADVQIRSSRFFTGGETRSLAWSVRRDTRNHPFDPQRGNLTLASVEQAGRWLGADHDFTKYRFVSQQFITFFKFLTLMVRGEAGLATTSGKAVPFAERYFVGGIFSVRGYDFRSIGPSVFVSTDPSNPDAGVTRVFVGGNKQLFFNSELLFPLIPPAGIKGLLFFDAGNTWLEEDRLLSSALRMGYGFGFRWFSPMGPLRFEWGFPVNRRPDERKQVFEFNIGTFF
ncbi:MAG: outer membrane protein assembly factor BamA [Candidatus Dadabacteria bacterium]|nr:MAG: outer membrane protein assembly factor BamA [Candidatus Dadabacteria bacterium]